MSQYQALKGMPDILPEASQKWQAMEAESRHFFEAYGFEEIRTPLVEPSGLFSRTLGEGSDIVHKQMYTFEDRGGRTVTLRPEMTASVVRAAVENGILRREKVTRLYYMGPMFRAERPQRGRQRQFHQLGAEILGAKPMEGDVEVLRLTRGLLDFLGIRAFRMVMNHLGCEKDRSVYREALKAYFAGADKELCEDCLYRREKNVLRILDCKAETCQPVIRRAPSVRLCAGCDGDYAEVRKRLDEERVGVEHEARLVRGLDYYTGLVFEVAAGGELGAQDAVAAGGRYDGLISGLGGPAMGATGFAAGMERLLLARGVKDGDLEWDSIYVATLDTKPETERYFTKLMKTLYRMGKKVKREPGLVSVSDHLKRANKLGIRFAIILGEDEVKTESMTVKDLKTKRQERVSCAEWPVFFADKMRKEALC
jgi:histidyl-tRNA synthetase